MWGLLRIATHNQLDGIMIQHPSIPHGTKPALVHAALAGRHEEEALSVQ